MENNHKIKGFVNNIFNFIKRRKAACFLAALLLAALVFLLNSNIESVQQHDKRIEQEENERRAFIERTGKEPQNTDELSVNIADLETGLKTAAITNIPYFYNAKRSVIWDALLGIALADNTTEAPQPQDTELNNQTDNNTAQSEQLQATDNISSEQDKTAEDRQNDQTSYNNIDSTDSFNAAASQNQTQQSNTKQENQNYVSDGNSQNVSDNSNISDAEQAYINIKIKIICDKVLGNPDLNTDAVLPDNGVIIDAKTVVKKGATVYDALTAVCNDNGIAYVNKGSASNAYIASINSLSEGDCGKYSGWKYKVNGNIASKACSSFKLQENDEILWYYATTYME